jgi:SAM-dependent methyltransferase
MGFGSGTLDPISKEFIKFSEHSLDPALDIGAGFGIATLGAILNGANVFATDLDSRHLEEIKANCPKDLLHKLTTVPGSFPEETLFENQKFTAILASRVFHFFDGPTLENAFKECFRILKPEGKLFVVFDSPYKRHWLEFLPEFEEKLALKERWPGFTNKLREFEKDRVEHLPEYINFMNKEILTGRLCEAGFIIEKAMYIARTDYPETSQLDGRENVGVIAIKR